jgi:hypothetical protein
LNPSDVGAAAGSEPGAIVGIFGSRRKWLVTEDTSPGECLANQKEGLRSLDALSKLNPRQREVWLLSAKPGKQASSCSRI